MSDHKSNNSSEYIICSAIHFDDGKEYVHQPKNIKSGFVVTGRRHHNCYNVLSSLGKALQFIKENGIEWRWEINNNHEDVIVFIPYRNIGEFAELLSAGDFDDDGIECHMKHGYIALWIGDTCEYNGVNIKEVFPKGN